MERHFYALLPDRGVSSLVDELRRRYYPRSLKLHPPHLTLVPPFRTDEADRLWQEVEKLAQRQPKFQLRLDGLGVFPHDKKILHLHVAGGRDLADFRAKLVTASGAEITFPEFNPHLSIGKLTDQETKKAMVELTNLNLKVPFTGERLVDFREKEDGGWENVREMGLN